MRAGRAYAATLSKDLVRVEVDRVSYALEVSRIREIVNPLPVVALPRERAFVLGVADYREEVVPVVDLRRLFGLESREPDRRTKWIILDAGAMPVGVVVDAVLDVFSSEENERKQVPVLDERHLSRGISFAYRHDEKLVFLLDADRLAEPAMLLSNEDLSILPSGAP
jgi:purine-binding chemotaxis protein CheW